MNVAVWAPDQILLGMDMVELNPIIELRNPGAHSETVAAAKLERIRRATLGIGCEGLIEKIVLTPECGRKDLRIDLHGDLAGILKIAARKEKRLGPAVNDNGPEPSKIKLVAGAGFEPATFGL